MADKLTQIQDAVDQVCIMSHLQSSSNKIQLAYQFIASLFYVNKHHDLQTLSATDIVRTDKKEGESTFRDPDGMAISLPRSCELS